MNINNKFDFNSAPQYPSTGWDNGLPSLKGMNADDSGSYNVPLHITLENGETVEGCFNLRDHNQDGGFVEYGFFDNDGNEINQNVVWEHKGNRGFIENKGFASENGCAEVGLTIYLDHQSADGEEARLMAEILGISGMTIDVDKNAWVGNLMLENCMTLNALSINWDKDFFEAIEEITKPFIATEVSENEALHVNNAHPEIPF